MTTFLKFVTHDAVNNTLEATWQDVQIDSSGNIIGYVNTKCINYGPSEKAKFLLDLGVFGQKYTTMSGW